VREETLSSGPLHHLLNAPQCPSIPFFTLLSVPYLCMLPFSLYSWF